MTLPIAAEVDLTLAAVKTHMHALFRTSGIDDLAQQEKRRTLVALALAGGLVRSGRRVRVTAVLRSRPAARTVRGAPAENGFGSVVARPRRASG